MQPWLVVEKSPDFHGTNTREMEVVDLIIPMKLAKIRRLSQGGFPVRLIELAENRKCLRLVEHC